MSRNCLIGMSKSLCDNCVKVPDKPQNALTRSAAPYGYICKIGAWRPGRCCSKGGCLCYNRTEKKDM